MKSLRTAAVASVMAWFCACGGAPELIDRTDPNYLRKSDLLDGTWYMLETVVDVPPTTGIAWEGFQSGLEKVRFEIQENQLVAYRSYELVPGTDPLIDTARSSPGDIVYRDGKPYRGAIVAAWTIDSHFDRQRQYNAATGQQSNVLEENVTDRPWHQREFVRVNWANPTITNHLSVKGILPFVTGKKLPNTALATYLPRDVGSDGEDVLLLDFKDAAKQQGL